MKISDILGSNERENLTQFSEDLINQLEKRIATRRDSKAGIECIVRGKNSDGDYFELTPEEIVRQLYAQKLIDKYSYPKELLDFEVPVLFAGKEKIADKRIDIIVWKDNKKDKPLMILEVKRPKITDENIAVGEETSPFQQMQSYCKQKQPDLGVIANGGNLLKFYSYPDYDKPIETNTFPKFGENIDEWKANQRFTLKKLMLNDELKNTTLKKIIQATEQRFAANDSSEKTFDEIFKLIFVKLYDECLSSRDADAIARDIKTHKIKLQDIDDTDFHALEFRVHDNEKPAEVKKRLDELFTKAQKKWSGIFPENTKFDMQPNTLTSCVKELQNVKLFNSNLEVVDDAFEYLVNKGQKEEMGQYFTPRYVIDMCVKMLNPNENESMIDTACGSCGFPMHTIFHVWKKINPKADNLFTTIERTNEEIDYVRDKVFGIDFSEKSVRVGRMLNIIAGDGHTNIIELNTLDYTRWEAATKDNKTWQSKYRDGFELLEEYSADEEHKCFNFDILMANPPFAGDLNNKDQLSPYELSKNTKGKEKNRVGRDILFIERNLDFIKPGGRMAIVLPQGRFNNSDDKYIRDYISERCRILAVVGLHGNVFKPHTGTKTSVLFLQKWTDEDCGFPNICPRKDDYPIFFATMQEPSKDNSGEKIYVTENYLTWTSYKYFAEEIFTRKSDGVEVSAEEYQKATKKSDYKREIKPTSKIIEHENSNGETRFIKDLFIKEHGAIEDHKKFIKANVKFVPKKNSDLSGELSVEEFCNLTTADAKKYNKVPILGENNNPLISAEEFNNLPSNEQRFYLPAETISEITERVHDTHGHIFVRHDLFNHDPSLENPNPDNLYSKDGIAEAFIEFAKKENLSFFDCGSFDELKYKNLSEELEVTEINFSYINNDIFRLDSFYYSKKFLREEKIISSMNTTTIKKMKRATILSFGAYSLNNFVEYLSEGVPFLQCSDMKNGIVEMDNVHYISEKVHHLLYKSEVFPETVLISMAGTIGSVALALPTWKYPVNSNQAIAKIRLNGEMNPYYLYAFFLSKFGQNYMIREARGSVQQNIFLSQIENFKIPVPTEEFAMEIEKICKNAFNLRELAEEKYHSAEKILSAELGLENFKPSTKNFAVKNLSQSFNLSGRLDAEFYQPKYDDIEQKILQSSIGEVKKFFKLVKKICDRKENFYNYIEIGDINISTGDAEKNLIATENLPDNAKIMTQAGDILVSKVRPNRGAISILKENNLLVSGAFAVLRAKENFSAEVLQILLRLPIYRELMLKFNVGTSYPVIKDEDVLNLPLPKIAGAVQEKISALVEESFVLRAESKKLLEEAKNLVETEIESEKF